MFQVKSVCKRVFLSAQIFWQIEKFLPSRHTKTLTQSDPTTKPSSLLLLRISVCVRACLWSCWKILGANVGVDYPPPLPLWSAANGTNCTVLSLMHWWAFSISVLLSWMLPPNPPSSPFHPHLSSNQLAACQGDVRHSDWTVLAAKCCTDFWVRCRWRCLLSIIYTKAELPYTGKDTISFSSLYLVKNRFTVLMQSTCSETETRL